MEKLRFLEKYARSKSKIKIAVVAAHDDSVLASIKKVYEKGYVEPILIGNRESIITIANNIQLDTSNVKIINELDDIQSARIAVDIISNNEADILMKGFIQTAELLHIILNKEKGLRTEKIISYVSLFDIQSYSKLLILSDVAVNIAPDLKQKAEIIKNSVALAKKIGIENPKVAVLSAIETVNSDIPSSVDAALLSKMAQRGQISGCTIDGPLAMDNAISLDAAKHKRIESDVAGDADILIVPNIESGNILYKGLVYLYGAKTCSIFTGAKVPIVVTSRSDDSTTKYFSILLAIAMSKNNE